MKLDTCFKILLFILFGMGYVAAMSYSQKGRQFPQLIAMMVLILLVSSFLQDLYRRLKERNRLAAGMHKTKAASDRSRRLRFYKAWLIILLAMAAGMLGGFLLSTLFLLAGFPVLLGQGKGRLIRDLSFAVVVTVCIYLVFQYVMGVPLLSGLLINL